MKCLIRKDILYLAEQKVVILMILLVAAIASKGIFEDSSSSSGFVVGYITIISVFVAMSTIAYDEADRGMLQILTMPVTRKTYVESKYVFAALMIFAGGVLSGAILTLLSGISLYETAVTVTSIYSVAFAMAAAAIPAYLKFGPQKGMLTVGAVVILIVIAAAGAVKLMRAAGIDIENIIENMTAGQTFGTVLFALAAGMILFLISFAVSLKIMMKKEF